MAKTTELRCHLKEALEQQGFVFSRRGGNIVLSPSSKLTAEQRAQLIAHKAEMLAALDTSYDKEPWSAAAAADLCKLALRKVDVHGWPEDRQQASAIAVLHDRIDRAYLAKDLGLLRAEVEGSLAAMDAAYPRKVRRVIEYEPPPAYHPVFVGWMRLRPKDRWLPVMRDVGDPAACGEMLSQYGSVFKSVDTTVLPTGQDPNENRKVR